MHSHQGHIDRVFHLEVGIVAHTAHQTSNLEERNMYRVYTLITSLVWGWMNVQIRDFHVHCLTKMLCRIGSGQPFDIDRTRLVMIFDLAGIRQTCINHLESCCPAEDAESLRCIQGRSDSRTIYCIETLHTAS